MSHAAGNTVTDPTPRPAAVGRIDLADDDVRQEVERQLARMEGVTAARVVPGSQRPIDELHLVATNERSPKQLSRDVQSLLIAQFGIEVDHRVVSVVQLADELVEDAGGEPRTVPGRRRQPLLQSVTTSDASVSFEATVVLEFDSEEHRGSSRGPSSLESRLTVVARATLDAVEPLLPDGYAVDLLWVDIASVSMNNRTVISTLNAQTARQEQLLSGSAVVSRDVGTAAARSVLDALNRVVDRERRSTP